MPWYSMASAAVVFEPSRRASASAKAVRAWRMFSSPPNWKPSWVV
ncbi:hypothetical protein [Rubrobacter marinus]|nr:hypothetical protein [Rubrobacter marinus]